ncbi:MAG: hypothetical protein A3A24_02210 [Candidatus Buchananbacteria bacterium RIFCSPLOWO2_01_FULL_46_12]|uniref:Uncharacterized protein n=2 Tax=Candidatus Buchananiibacteriota TaxID=1817903 RepID=A0A1G1YQA8_9BACT|nr:MAG: hypothetical protein A2744_02055 [Candidatus Buchananbacteria bacterium RIFCSPHIGHO2_01_FULL_44_11]OGY54479.1 MAG: hypothetical protein A3A24_02210 [Candidatus Buchananbacteria bacterium RIFCSPLOWO2_01_FULL_46_12]
MLGSFQENPSLQAYWSNRLIKFNLLFSLLVNILVWLILVRLIRNFSESIIFHYNIYFGVDLLGNWYEIFWLPASGLFIIFLNFILASLFSEKEKIISYFLVSASSLVQVLIFLASLTVIFINL